MDYKQLGYFAKVAELGSYTRAAEELDVSQPLLSRQIRLLEVELRCNLLIRNGRGVTLTESGRLLLQHCHRILAQFRELKEDLHPERGKITGQIAIGIPPTLSKLFAVELIKQFRGAFPDAGLIVQEGFTLGLQEQLALGRLQIALLHNPELRPDIEYHALLSLPLMLITAGNAPLLHEKTHITAADFARLPLIMPSSHNTFRQQLDHEMRKRHLNANIILEVDSKEVILDLVAQGVGVSVQLPTVLALRHGNDLAALPIAEPHLPCALYMATGGRLPPGRLQQAVMGMIRALCARHFPGHCLGRQR